jgi:hypothetical protein
MANREQNLIKFELLVKRFEDRAREQEKESRDREKFDEWLDDAATISEESDEDCNCDPGQVAERKEKHARLIVEWLIAGRGEVGRVDVVREDVEGGAG